MLKATVVITTKDRCGDLREALNSCINQSVRPEIIVVDDASTDGTAKMLAEEYADIRVLRHSKPLGLIVGRNEAADAASGDVLFSIDDDAVFVTPSVIEQTLEQFDDPRVGAVAIPYVDVKKSPTVRQLSPSDDGAWCLDRFIGTAHALRRDVFLELGGYREFLFHQGEERDYCIRLLDAGYVVRAGNSDLIHHFESPKRDTTRMDLYGRRNDILFAWLNLPWSQLPLHILGTTVKGLTFGVRVGRPLRMFRGLVMGYAGIIRHWSERSPVSGSTHRIFCRLQNQGFVKLSELTPDLPPIAPAKEE